MTRSRTISLQTIWSRGAIYLLLVAFALYFLMPVYVLVNTSFKPYTEVSIQRMWELPRGVYLGSFAEAWSKVSPNFVNSLLITVPAAIISSFIGSINGYIFSKWRFKGSNTIFLLFLIGMFLPYQGVLIPMVLTLRSVGLYGTIPGLIFIHCVFGIPITALMFRSYYAGVPDDLVDAGKIDGCGFFGIYRHILLPIAAPAFAVVLLWQFTSIWNDFIIGLVVLSNPRLAPVTVAVQNLAGSFTTEWNIQMAGALIAAAPTIIVYLLLGKLFMRGLLAGSVKG
ncbi:MAG: carbohydrate ABC transporter permease [Candidatus Brachytrichaceae bacterium NZ_4S206]|jgi:glucose/mannose transport system permease protein